MDAENSKLTNEQSLEIISEMIQTAKGTVANNSFYFLFWGWVCVFANLGHYALIEFSSFKAPYMVWLIMIPGGLFSFGYGFFQEKKAKVKTYTSSVTFWIWMTFVAGLIAILLVMPKMNYQISPLIMIITSMATFLSGIVLKFKPLLVGGILFWLFGVTAFYVSYENQLLMSAASLISGYLVPGYMLKMRGKNG